MNRIPWAGFHWRRFRLEDRDLELERSLNSRADILSFTTANQPKIQETVSFPFIFWKHLIVIAKVTTMMRMRGWLEQAQLHQQNKIAVCTLYELTVERRKWRRLWNHNLLRSSHIERYRHGKHAISDKGTDWSRPLPSSKTDHRCALLHHLLTILCQLF